MIKYKNEIIFNKQVANVSVDSGWCNSMLEYYPSIYVAYFENNKLTGTRIALDIYYSSDSQVMAALEIKYNDADVAQYEAVMAQRKAEREEQERIAELMTVKWGRTVKVVSGRKIPVGTEGKVFWVGDTRYGRSVGLEINGRKQFTSIRNVEVVLA